MSDIHTAPAADVFDLSEIATNDTGTLAIRHPVTGEPTSWVLTLAGPGHPAYEEWSAEGQREAARKSRAIEQARANGKKWKAEESDVEAEEAKARARLSRIILGWTPVRVDGADYPWSKQNAEAMCVSQRWNRVRAQILEYMNDEKAFTTRSATA